MTPSIIAEFADAGALAEAARRIKEAGHQLVDAFTPFPIEGLSETFDVKPSRVRWAMLAGGLAFAVFAYWIQWWSAVRDYPFNVGGRPLNSWPVFLLVPCEVGMLAAALAGLIAFFWQCGLPRLHHPVFDVTGFERATQDRFFLLTREVTDKADESLRDLLLNAGALMVSEVRS